MSIIIRLQNLPWSANALDIRQFFGGLQIPEGGVHIVGGELGDAFIAFSTDEDARQAFLRSDGTIKGIQIKLMLSSRTEMQRVIEQARTQSMSAFMLPSNNNLSVAPAPVPAAVPQMLPAAVPEIQKEASKNRNNDDVSEKKRDKRRSSRSKSRERRDRSRERRRRDRRSRSKSRERRRRGRSRSRGRSRDRSRKERTKSNERKVDKPRNSPPNQRDIKNANPTDIWNKPVQPMITPPTNHFPGDAPSILGSAPWGLDQSVKSNVATSLTTNLQARKMNGFQSLANPQQARDLLNSPMGNSWPAANPPSVRENFGRMDFSASDRNRRNFIGDEGMMRPGFQNDQRSRRDFNDFPPRLQREEGELRLGLNPRRSRFDENSGPNKGRFDNTECPPNACVSLKPFNDSYGDLRRFFGGLGINYKGIKIINDEFGIRTGVCFIQFRDEQTKLKALQMDGSSCSGQPVTIKSISDEVFDEAIDRYNPKMGNFHFQAENLERVRNTKKFLSNETEISDFVCLKVEGLPSVVKEQDILHIFSQHPLISLHLDIRPKGGTVAFVKFSSKEVAKMALKEQSHHVINGKTLQVKPCSDEEFKKFEEVTSVRQDEDMQEDQSVSEELISDCLSLAHLPVKSNDRDISDFFSDIGLIPAKIHLISDSAGFTGQAYCEFYTPEEAAKAVSKDNTMLGHNTVQVQLISRADMDGILNNSLPHPGLTPGETLALSTPLPLIQPSNTAESPSPRPVDDIVLETEENDHQEEAAEPDDDVQLVEDDPVKEGEPARLNFEAPKGLQDMPLRPRFNGPRKSRFNNVNNFNDNRGLNINSDFNDNDGFNDNDEFNNCGFNGPQMRGPFGQRDQQGRFNHLRNNVNPENGRPCFNLREGPPFPRRGLRLDMPEEEGDQDSMPGCTVYMDNVPYKAGTNEILDFFDGYGCTNNVSRRYNSNNTPSGEAKVTFYNPKDAFKAVRELHGQKIWNRTIFLRQE
ncbi:RNA-binding protein 12 [Euwallacea similis]|uniref:RNA-binding protein 12 n=1 Tax=Euwallacea similis TaxID=1736056 RepID=UPI00344C8FAA